jgi:hypothetical protein
VPRGIRVCRACHKADTMRTAGHIPKSRETLIMKTGTPARHRARVGIKPVGLGEPPAAAIRSSAAMSTTTAMRIPISVKLSVEEGSRQSTCRKVRRSCWTVRIEPTSLETLESVQNMLGKCCGVLWLS